MMSEKEGKELPVRHDSSISFAWKKKNRGGKKKTHPCERVLLHDIARGRNIHENVACKFQGHSSAISCTQRSMASWEVELVDAELQAHPIYRT